MSTLHFAIMITPYVKLREISEYHRAIYARSLRARSHDFPRKLRRKHAKFARMRENKSPREVCAEGCATGAVFSREVCAKVALFVSVGTFEQATVVGFGWTLEIVKLTNQPPLLDA